MCNVNTVKVKNIALIGSTGSIGRQTIEVVGSHPDRFKIIGIAANKNSAAFKEQLCALNPPYFAAAEEDERGALEIAALPEADIVLVACGGFAGLKYSLTAIAAKKTLALANKETLVCGGDIVMPLAEKNGVDVLPVDSEHSAIWQCLNFNRKAPIKRLIITASGGAFRGYSYERLKSVTPAQAICHPNWNMGAKITVDSATMLNKGFEVIEAHHLYGAEYARINAVIHPQSIVHSMVEFEDGAILAQLSEPTMHLPIQAALSYPERINCPQVKRLDFEKALSLQFLPIQKGEYPCYDIALECARTGGNAPAVLNAASERAVALFLKGALPFTDISAVIKGALDKVPYTKAASYDDVADADFKGRSAAEEVAESLVR